MNFPVEKLDYFHYLVGFSDRKIGFSCRKIDFACRNIEFYYRKMEFSYRKNGISCRKIRFFFTIWLDFLIEKLDFPVKN